MKPVEVKRLEARVGKNGLFAPRAGYQVGGLREALRESGTELILAECEASLLGFVDQYAPRCAVVFCEPRLEDGASRLAEQIQLMDCTPLWVLTSVISAEYAVSAMRAGVSDLIDQAISIEKLISCLRSACERYERART